MKQNLVHCFCDFCTIVCSSLTRNEKTSYENNFDLLFGECNTEVKGNCRKRYQTKGFDWSVIKQCHRIQSISDVNGFVVSNETVVLCWWESEAKIWFCQTS